MATNKGGLLRRLLRRRRTWTVAKPTSRPEQILVLAGSPEQFRRFANTQRSLSSCVYGRDEVITRGCVFTRIVLARGYQDSALWRCRHDVWVALDTGSGLRFQPLAYLPATLEDDI